MSRELDDALASGDEEAIEAALADAEISDDMLFEEDYADKALPEKAPEAEQEVSGENTSDKNDVAEKEVAVAAEEEAAPESSPAEEVNKPGFIEKDGKFFVEVSKDNAEIGSKNGKHQLPYDLLVGTREENLALKKQLEDQARSNAELQDSLSESKRVAELYTKQLGEAGLDPKLLPEQMLQNPELMAQVKEDYPQIGELVEALASQLQKQTTTHHSAEPAKQTETPSGTANPMEDALNQSNHLKGWMNDDADRWGMAKIIDSKLADDPLFANKTISERFAEVEKRVMSAFGDEIPVTEDDIQDSAKTLTKQPEKSLVPNSPTDIGHQGSDMSASSQFMEKDAETMTRDMEKMSEADIEAMLEDVSDFL